MTEPDRRDKVPAPEDRWANALQGKEIMKTRQNTMTGRDMAEDLPAEVWAWEGDGEEALDMERVSEEEDLIPELLVLQLSIFLCRLIIAWDFRKVDI